MRKVSMRQFQLDANREIKKGLPLELTKHGKTVVYVTDINPEPLKREQSTSIDFLSEGLQGVTEMVRSLKTQTYDHSPQKLITCETHHVYKQTCGCA